MSRSVRAAGAVSISASSVRRLGDPPLALPGAGPREEEWAEELCETHRTRRREVEPVVDEPPRLGRAGVVPVGDLDLRPALRRGANRRIRRAVERARLLHRDPDHGGDALADERLHDAVDVVAVLGGRVVVAHVDHDDAAERLRRLRHEREDALRPVALVRAAGLGEPPAHLRVDLQIEAAGEGLSGGRLVRDRGRHRVAEQRHSRTRRACSRGGAGEERARDQRGDQGGGGAHAGTLPGASPAQSQGGGLYTQRPPTIVATTCTSGSSSGGMVTGSRSSTTRSARYPGSSFPRLRSSPASQAGATVDAWSACSIVTASLPRQPGRSSIVRSTPAAMPASGSSSSTGASEPFATTAPLASSVPNA